MRAFHTLRTRPNTDSKMKDFELFTVLLSALEWKKHNGIIDLVTDSKGLSFLSDCGISNVWDNVDTYLDGMNHLGIDENTFWAGAKLYALSRQQAPCVMIDLDFIIWQHLDFSQYGTNVAVIHRELVGNSTYPSKEHFRSKNAQWPLPDDLDWLQEACNTAFVYFGDKTFMDMYCKWAFDFMRYADTHNAGLPYMVFAEQRLISMCAVKLGKQIHTFSTLSELFNQEQNFYTHIWGYKETLRRDCNAANQFCQQCANRIRHDFPYWMEELKNFDWAAKYL